MRRKRLYLVASVGHFGFECRSYRGSGNVPGRMSENEEIIAHGIVIEYSVNKSPKTGKIKNWLHMILPVLAVIMSTTELL